MAVLVNNLLLNTIPAVSLWSLGSDRMNHNHSSLVGFMLFQGRGEP